MSPIQSWSISTWIAALVLQLLRRSPSAVSWVCDRCGCAIDAHREDGIGLSAYAIHLNPPKLLPYNLCVALTADGKLSIYCGCLPFAELRSQIHSGKRDGTSFTPTS